jgi:hypothetical protein
MKEDWFNKFKIWNSYYFTFFVKELIEYELNGMVAREMNVHRVILFGIKFQNTKYWNLVQLCR